MNEDGILLSKNTNHDLATREAPPRGESFWSSWRETLVVSASFMSAYTAYLALQSLQSSLNQEQGLGVVSLACLYGTVILSGILTPSFIRLVGPKWSLVVAWACHCVYTACNFYPTWATLIPASIVLGASAGPMWTSQGLYITASGMRLSKISGEKLHAVLSKLNGVFFMCYECTQVTGNLISSLVLKQGSLTQSNNVTQICGADDCPTSGNSTTDLAEPEPHIVYTLLGIFLACDVIALVITLFFLPQFKKTPTPEDSTEQPLGIGRTLLSWFTALSDPKLFLLVIFFLSSAMSQGILFADYTKAFISCSLGVSMVGYVMACHGVVTAVVAIVTSQAAKYTGRYVLFGTSIVCNAAMLLTLVLWKPRSDFIGPIFIIPSLWGIAIGIFHTQFNTLVGLMFPEKQEAAFANFHTWNGIGFTITFAYGGALCVRAKLYVCLALFALGSLGYFLAEIIFLRQTREARKASSRENNSNSSLEFSLQEIHAD